MKREYKFKVETVKQHLTGRYDVITIMADSVLEAEFILADMVRIRDDQYDGLSSYQTYSYELMTVKK